MISTRLVGVILVKSGWAVQSIKFRDYLPIGNPQIAVNFLDRWGVDEIVLLDIDSAMNSICGVFKNLPRYVRGCHTPIAVGGGISKIEDVENCIRFGGDKVVINSSLSRNPHVIEEASREFGKQAVVVSIDVKLIDVGKYRVVWDGGTTIGDMSPEYAAAFAQDLGAGEILINSVDRDGAKTGYDLELIRNVIDAVSIPIVICGGVGRPAHFLEGIRLGVSGVAAANYFNYTEHSVIVVKRYLQAQLSDQRIRLDTVANYQTAKFDPYGRILLRDKEYLDSLKHQYIPKPTI